MELPIESLPLSLKDKNHNKDIIMNDNLKEYLMILITMTIAVFIGTFFGNVAHAQTQFYASCESPNEIILQKKACDRRFNDCLPLPKLDHNHFKLKCVEETFEDKSKPIYAKDCPEGEVSHTETICEAPEFLAENQEENCYELEVMCEPESYGMSTRMVLAEDVELVQAEKAQVQAKREFQEQKQQAREEALEALTRRPDGTFRGKQEVQEIIEGMRGDRAK